MSFITETINAWKIGAWILVYVSMGAFIGAMAGLLIFTLPAIIGVTLFDVQMTGDDWIRWYKVFGVLGVPYGVANSQTLEAISDTLKDAGFNKC